MAPDRRRRIALTFVAAIVLYVVIVLVAGEPVNLATIVLGVVLAALIVWWGEARRRMRADVGGSDGGA
jgi:hypothetical protein